MFLVNFVFRKSHMTGNSDTEGGRRAVCCLCVTSSDVIFYHFKRFSKLDKHTSWITRQKVNIYSCYIFLDPHDGAVKRFIKCFLVYRLIKHKPDVSTTFFHHLHRFRRPHIQTHSICKSLYRKGLILKSWHA